MRTMTQHTAPSTRRCPCRMRHRPSTRPTKPPLHRYRGVGNDRRCPVRAAAHAQAREPRFSPAPPDPYPPGPGWSYWRNWSYRSRHESPTQMKRRAGRSRLFRPGRQDRPRGHPGFDPSGALHAAVPGSAHHLSAKHPTRMPVSRPLSASAPAHLTEASRADQAAATTRGSTESRRRTLPSRGPGSRTRPALGDRMAQLLPLLKASNIGWERPRYPCLFESSLVLGEDQQRVAERSPPEPAANSIARTQFAPVIRFSTATVKRSCNIAILASRAARTS